jgi:hypothetical protein
MGSPLTHRNAGLFVDVQSVLGAASLSAFATAVVALAATTAAMTSKVSKRIDRFSMVSACCVTLGGVNEVSLFVSLKNLPLAIAVL